MVAGDRPPSSNSKEEEEKGGRRNFLVSQFFAVRGAEADPHGRPGSSLFQRQRLPLRLFVLFRLRFPGTKWRSTCC